MLVSVAVLGALGLVGCGEGENDPTVVRVGRDAIGQRTVAHWSRVVERGGMLGRSAREDRGSARERAVAFLISSSWLTGEAKRLGISITDEAVDRAVKERSVANGEAEFDESLRATGKTIADIKQEIRAEQALAVIRGSLAKQAARLSEGEVEAFYKRNRSMFVISEARDVDLIETFPSAVAARVLVRRVGGGVRFAKKAFHEKPSRDEIGKWKIPDKEAILRAIFATRPGVVSAPMRLSERWIVFVVRRIVPPRVKSLADVQGEIARLLTARRKKQLALQFDRAYKARWSARTSCRAGYVVWGCAQYSGTPASEENPFATA